MTTFLILALLAVGLYSVEAKVVKTVAKCDKIGDVMFVIDGSESIKTYDFPKLIQFTLKNVDSLVIRADRAHVGGMVYSSEIKDYFSPMDSAADVKSKISAFPHTRNLSRTDLALTYLSSRLLKTSRARVGVIISDGDSKYPNLTKSEAEKARKGGIVLLAVGIGATKHEEVELENIVGGKDRYIVVKNADELSNEATIKDFQARICEELRTAPIPRKPQVPDEVIIDPLCYGCIIANGFGYNSHPHDCSKFIQCYPSQDVKGLKVMTSAVKQCSYGTLWSQDDLTCVKSNNTKCKKSICKAKSDGTTLRYLGCKTYWKCDAGLPVAKCCNAGHHYDEKRGACVVGIPSGCSGVECGENAAASTRKLNLCGLEGNKRDPTKYYQILKISSTKSMKLLRSCAPGTIFNEGKCHCVFDINGISKSTDCKALVSQNSMSYGKSPEVEVSGDTITFTNKDHINIWRLANHEFQESLGVTFSVKLKPYTSRRGSKTEQIMVNCLHTDKVNKNDNCSASISIQVRKSPGWYTFIGELNTVDIDSGDEMKKTIHISVSSTSGYIDLVYAYDGRNFAMKVGGSESSTPLSGWVQRRQSGFIFGRPMLITGPVKFLDGSIKWIKIYDCIHDGIRDALRVM